MEDEKDNNMVMITNNTEDSLHVLNDDSRCKTSLLNPVK